MARNAEKAMTALARWRKFKIEEEHPELKEKRPQNPQDVTNPRKAERWRRDVIKEIGKLIAQIQNPGLGEFKIRDLNDEINKMIREKGQWEVRIKELGGQDFLKNAQKWFDREGHEVPGMGGYKYFGAAKDLPGVREIIEKPHVDKPRKSRTDLMKHIDAEYYGYMDDDDGVLIPLERAAEIAAIEKAVTEFKEKKDAGQLVEKDEPDIYPASGGLTGYSHPLEESDDEGESASQQTRPGIEYDELGQPSSLNQVSIPTQKDIEFALINRKKMELIEKYASDSLIQQCVEARTLMGFETEQTMTALAYAAHGESSTSSEPIEESSGISSMDTS